MGFLSLVRVAAHLSIRIVGDALAPPSCAACDAPLRRQAVFCGPCASTVMGPPTGEARAFAGASYGGAIAEAVRRFKYGGRPDLAHPLSHLVRAAARRTKADSVVPVPLHPRRLAERGYNQALLLAGGVSDELSAPLRPRVMERVLFARPQASLTKDERAKNLCGAFHVRAPAAVAGRRVALVDDVLTTGATFEACRSALLDAGAVSVVAVVVAETPRA